MRNLFTLSALLLTVFCQSQVASKTTVIDLETLKTEAIGKDVQLIDVRTANEYNSGHIDDAVNIDIMNNATFEQEVQKLDKSKPVFLYCKLGGRSKRASKKLEELGFEKIYDFSGGYSAWNSQ